jgi:hypothetical protein
MSAMCQIHIPIPDALSMPVNYILNADIRKELEKENTDLEELESLVEKLNKLCFEPDKKTLSFVASMKINAYMQQLSKSPRDITLLTSIIETFNVIESLHLDLDIWESQNIYYHIGKQHIQEIEEKAQSEDLEAQTWMDTFSRLGNFLNVSGVISENSDSHI